MVIGNRRVGGARSDFPLAFAVISGHGGLTDSRITHFSGDLREAMWMRHRGKTRHGKAVAIKKSLLDEAVLYTAQDAARRAHRSLPLEFLAKLSRHIFPLVRHGGHQSREVGDCLPIGERCRKRVGGESMRRSVGIRVPHGNAIAESCGRTRKQRPQLAAAEDAEHGSRFNDGWTHD